MWRMQDTINVYKALLPLPCFVLSGVFMAMCAACNKENK